MGSRAFLLLGLLVVVALLISSEEVARDLAETYGQKNAEATKEANGVDNAKYGGGYPGGGYGGYPGGGGGYGSRGGYGGRGRCYYGCCRGDYYGRGCRRCCSYTGEAPDAVTEDKPQN